MKTLKRLAVLTVVVVGVFFTYDKVVEKPENIVRSVSAEGYMPEIHCKHFFYGYPYGTDESNDLIIRDIYALSSNDETKFADWVAYKLTYDMTTGSGKDRNWKPDPWLDDAETLEPDDYKGAYKALGTDRGHLAPLGSFDGTETWYEVNYLSNIVPQKSSMNRGPWKQLEDAVRDLLNTYRDVYVMTGTIYETENMELPGADEDAVIPNAFWKIICVPIDNEKFETAAFIMPQEVQSGTSFIDYAVSIDDVESRTGLDFLWQLEDETEKNAESRIKNEWMRSLLLSRN